MSKQANNELWTCPFCDYRVKYGQHCPDIEASDNRHYTHATDCTRGVKNIVWYTVNRAKATQSEGVGIGISEIANDEM